MSRVNKQVRLKEDTLKRLSFFKNNPNESYDDVINRIIMNPDEIREKMMDEETKARKEEQLNLMHAWSEFIPEIEKYFKDNLKIINKEKPKNLVLKSPPLFPVAETKEEIMKKKRKYYGLPEPPQSYRGSGFNWRF